MITALIAHTVTSLVGIINSTYCFRDLIWGFVIIVLLYCVYRGYSWARWLIAVLSLVITIGLLILIPQVIYLGVYFVVFLVSIVVGMGSVSGILLLAPSVRSFQRYQREAKAANPAY